MRKRKVLRLVFVATMLFTTPVFRLGRAGIASECAGCVASEIVVRTNEREPSATLFFKKAGYCVAQAKNTQG